MTGSVMSEHKFMDPLGNCKECDFLTVVGHGHTECDKGREQEKQCMEIYLGVLESRGWRVIRWPGGGHLAIRPGASSGPIFDVK